MIGVTSRARVRIGVTLFLAAAGIAALGPSGHAYPRPGHTELVTIPKLLAAPLDVATTDAVCGGSHAGQADVSVMDITPDGRFLGFATAAGSLVDNDTNLACDVFVMDRNSSEITRASISSTGQEGLAAGVLSDLMSTDVSLSANGRFVAFSSNAETLVPGDTNEAWDVFVHDRATGLTRRVSVSSHGAQAENVDPNDTARSPDSSAAAISANGRFVAFSSNASDLVDDDTNASSDVFVHDLRSGRTQRGSVTSEGRDLGTLMQGPSLSADGESVVFYSYGSLQGWVFVHDFKDGKTTNVVHGVGGEKPNNNSSTQSLAPRQISADGRYVVYRSWASNLVPHDGNQNSVLESTFNAFSSANDIFVFDRKTGRTERVSVTSTGAELPMGVGNESVAISPDGRFVTFESRTDAVEREPANSTDWDAYVYDRATGAIEWVSVDKDGGDSCSSEIAEGFGFNFSYPGALSAGARHALLVSNNPCLVERDVNLFPADIFLRSFGSTLGVGGFGERPSSDPIDDVDQICVAPDLCIPPGGVIRRHESMSGDGLSRAGVDLIGLRIAHRPEHHDLFVAADLLDMPRIGAGTHSVGLPGVLHGLRFEVGTRSFEVRATGVEGGTFELFDCSAACIKVARLDGGFGTTGASVVFAIPLETIGLDDGGALAEVEAFTAVGSSVTGAVQVLDRIRLH